MNYNQQHAVSIAPTTNVDGALVGEFPYISEDQISQYIFQFSKSTVMTPFLNNYFGFNRPELSCNCWSI